MSLPDRPRIVVVFQKGVGTELFGFEQVDAIEAWLPLFAGFATGELVMFQQWASGWRWRSCSTRR